MTTKKCEIGKTEFVDDKTIDNISFVDGNGKKNKEETKINKNTYQCQGKAMKGDIYGTK